MDHRLSAALLFSKALVESRNRGNHGKRSLSANNDEEILKIVGQKMQISNLNKIVSKIKNYDKEPK